MRADARIEPAAPVDAERIAALAREIWCAHYPAIIGVAQIEYMLGQRYDPALIRAELARCGLWWDKLTVGDELAGFASYFLADRPQQMRLDKIYVHPRRQRRGYGALLIEHACARAREQGCTKLWLAVNKNNRNAIAAYLKHGFAVADAVVTDIGEGFVMDDYIMARSL